MRIKLDYPITLSEIVASTSGTYYNIKERNFNYISTDSREVFKNDLFFALSGEKYNGENFVNDAIKKGAIAISNKSSKGCISVKNTKDALLNLASSYKKKFTNLKHTVAITGSVGKTTTKEFLYVLANEKYKTHATYKNQNNDIGVPITLFSMPRDTEVLIVEMGMNHSGEIGKLSRCASPDIAIILNIGTAHIGNLGSRENIAKTKLEVTEGLGNNPVLIPKNEPLLECKTPHLTFSTTDKNADFYLKKDEDGGISFYSHNNLLLTSKFHLKEEQYLNCLSAATSAAVSLGLDALDLSRGISLISYDNTRQSVIFAKDIYFLADLYNASLESIKAGLEAVNSMPDHHRKSILLGDVLELGDKTEEIHKEIGRLISGYNFHNIYLFGKYSSYTRNSAIENGFPKRRIYINEDTEAPEITADQIKAHHTEGEIILVKGSRGMRLERILRYFDINDLRL